MLMGVLSRTEKNIYNMIVSSILEYIDLNPSVATFTSTVSSINFTSDTHDKSVFEVLDKQGSIDQKVLDLALESDIKLRCDSVLSYDTEVFNDKIVEQDQNLIDHVVENTTIDSDGTARWLYR